MSTIADKIKSLGLVKADLKDALLEKGQNPGNTLSTYPDLIRNIETGGSVDDSNLKWMMKLGINKKAYKDQYLGKNQIFYLDGYANRIDYYPKVTVNGEVIYSNSQYERLFDSFGDDDEIEVVLYAEKSPLVIHNGLFYGDYFNYIKFSTYYQPKIVESTAFLHSTVTTSKGTEIGVYDDEDNYLYALPLSIVYFQNNISGGFDIKRPKTVYLPNTYETYVGWVNVSYDLNQNSSYFYLGVVPKEVHFYCIKDKPYNFSSVIEGMPNSSSTSTNSYSLVIEDSVKNIEFGRTRSISGSTSPSRLITGITFKSLIPPTYSEDTGYVSNPFSTTAKYIGYRTSGTKYINVPSESLSLYQESPLIKGIINNSNSSTNKWALKTY